MSLNTVYQHLRELQKSCIITHDNVRNRIFFDIDYSVVASIAPVWIMESGNCAEDSLPKVMFEKLVNQNNNALTNKLLYYYDCDMLVSTLQDRFSIIESLLTKFYQKIPVESKYKLTDFDSFSISSEPELFAYLNSIFIYIGSTLDIITKVAYELQSIQTIDYSNYPYMKSKRIQFGDRRRISNINIQNTIFEYPAIVRKIEAIRNRIVHDGSFDFNQNIYAGWIKDKDLVERCILFPDFDVNGNFVSIKNRCNFYSESTRINLTLPSILNELFALIKFTILEINRFYDIQRYSNTLDIVKFRNEIEHWTKSFVSILSKDLPIRD